MAACPSRPAPAAATSVNRTLNWSTSKGTSRADSSALSRKSLSAADVQSRDDPIAKRFGHGFSPDSGHRSGIVSAARGEGARYVAAEEQRTQRLIAIHVPTVALLKYCTWADSAKVLHE